MDPVPFIIHRYIYIYTYSHLSIYIDPQVQKWNKAAHEMQTRQENLDGACLGSLLLAQGAWTTHPLPRWGIPQQANLWNQDVASRGHLGQGSQGSLRPCCCPCGGRGSRWEKPSSRKRKIWLFPRQFQQWFFKTVWGAYPGSTNKQ